MKEFIIITVAFVLLAGIMFYASDKQAKAECLKWQKYSLEYPEFYLASWQKAQCDYVGVEINAPVLGQN